jgi:hypothetical protein
MARKDDPATARRATLVETAACAACAALLLLWFVFQTPVTGQNGGQGSDGAIYVTMSRPPGDVDPASVLARVAAHDPRTRYTRDEVAWYQAHSAPYARRVLFPWILGVLGGDPVRVGRWVGFAAHLGALVLLVRVLARLGTSRGARWLALGLYATSFGVVRIWAHLPCYSDPLTHLFWMAGLYAAVARRWWLALPVVTLGVLHKESLALLVPVVVAARWSAGERAGRAPFAAAALIAALAPLLALRFLVHPVNDYDALGEWWEVFGRYVGFLEGHKDPPVFWALGLWPKIALSLGTGMGVLILLALQRPRAFVRFLGREPLWLLVLAVGLFAFFGGYDRTRLYLYMAPVFAVFVARWWDAGDALPRPLVSAWLAAGGALHLYLGAHLRPLVEGPLEGSGMFPAIMRHEDVYARLRAVAPWVLAWVGLGLALLVLARQAGSARARPAS